MRRVIWMVLGKAARLVTGLLLAALAVLILILVIPVRYRLFFQKEKESTARMDAQAFWLFGAVTLRYRYDNQEGKTVLSILGFPVYGGKAKESASGEPDVVPGDGGMPSAGDQKPAAGSSGKNEGHAAGTSAGDAGPEARRSDAQTSSEDQEFPLDDEILPEPENRIRTFLKKCARFLELLRMEETHDAAAQAGRLLIQFLRHVFPSQLGGELSFGMEDPCNTGYLLAAWGMMIPLHHNAVHITADFEAEENELSGEAFAKGRLIAGRLLYLAVRGFISPQIRNTVRRLQGGSEESAS